MMAKKTGRRQRPVVAERRGPSLLMIAGIVVVLLFAGGVGFGVYRAQQHATGSSAIPANATAYGVPVGKADAPNTVDIYLDFQCPVCKAYEQQSGPTLDNLIDTGAAKVVYHPVAFLDSASTTQYSTRSSEASGCAAQAGTNVFRQFVKLLYANQPPEGGNGLPDSQLISLGQQAGAGPDFAACVTNHTFAAWAASLTDAASRAGVNATPTIKVNGNQIGNSDAALRQAVQPAK